jgi:cytochrome c oxidase assembly factor CtaG
MADIANKYAVNVSGKFYVDDQCIDCDLCRETVHGVLNAYIFTFFVACGLLVYLPACELGLPPNMSLWRLCFGLMAAGTLMLLYAMFDNSSSPDVLYTPYLDVICRWNIPPLVDQRWAGLVMFVAGVPVQLVSVWLLLGLGAPQNRSGNREAGTPVVRA